MRSLVAQDVDLGAASWQCLCRGGNIHMAHIYQLISAHLLMAYKFLAFTSVQCAEIHIWLLHPAPIRSLSPKAQTTRFLSCLRMGIAVERQISFHACFPSGHHKETNFIPSSLPVWPPKRQKNTWVLGLVRQGPWGAWFYILSEWGKRNAGICPATRRCFSLKVVSWPANFFLLDNYSAFFQTSLQSLNSCILGFIVAVLPVRRVCSLQAGGVASQMSALILGSVCMLDMYCSLFCLLL